MNESEHRLIRILCYITNRQGNRGINLSATNLTIDKPVSQSIHQIILI